ncbi:hypothetical protein QVD17_41292 [Tagetes erecta]|uniref:Uncharacterized protein n=1 Tax=Tagetes erecta TaxID=13708 RepID=A0AAD8JSR3_TARER|nr:hypothetical protein QVD17_41292 [Tagetes erecta]
MRPLVKRLGFSINNKSSLIRPYSKRTTFIHTSSVVRSLEAVGFTTKQADDIKSEIKDLQRKQFLMLEAEMVKLQNEVEKKTEALEVETEMLLERLLTNQSAAITNISYYELKRELSVAKALLDASNATKNSDLQRKIARGNTLDPSNTFGVTDRFITATSSSDLVTDHLHGSIVGLNPFVSEAFEQTCRFMTWLILDVSFGSMSSSFEDNQSFT